MPASHSTEVKDILLIFVVLPDLIEILCVLILQLQKKWCSDWIIKTANNFNNFVAANTFLRYQTLAIIILLKRCLKPAKGVFSEFFVL